MAACSACVAHNCGLDMSLFVGLRAVMPQLLGGDKS